MVRCYLNQFIKRACDDELVADKFLKQLKRIPIIQIAQLCVFLFFTGDDVLRLQRHGADRAIAWMILLDLWMHRAGVNDLCWFSESRVSLKRHSAFRQVPGVALSTPSHIGQKYFPTGLCSVAAAAVSAGE